MKTIFGQIAAQMKHQHPNGSIPLEAGLCGSVREKCSDSNVPEPHLCIIRERMQQFDSGKAVSRPWSEIRVKYLPLITVFLVLFFAQSVSGIDSHSVTDTLSVMGDTAQETSSGHSYHYTQADDYNPNDDWAPGLGIMALFLILAALFTMGAGIVVALFILAVFVALVIFGVMSTSLLIGFSRKSFSAGLKVFLLSSSVIFSTVTLGTLALVLNHYFHWGSPQMATAIGAGAGALIGLLLGWLVYHVLKKISTYLVVRLKSERTPP